MINAIRKQNEAVRNLLESSKEFYKLSSKDSLGIPTRCLSIADYYGTYTDELNYKPHKIIIKVKFFEIIVVNKALYRLVRCLWDILWVSVLNQESSNRESSSVKTIKTIYLSNNYKSLKEEIEYYDGRDVKEGAKVVAGCEEGGVLKAFIKIRKSRRLGANLITGLDNLKAGNLIRTYKIILLDTIEILKDVKKLCTNKTQKERRMMLAMIKGLWNYDYINGLLLRHENTIWKRFGGETTLEIWWEGQASNYYILSWAIRNKVKKSI